MTDAKFKIGQKVFWVEHSCHRGNDVPCPICNGNLFVKIILGNGVVEKSECGYCSHGMDGPTGTYKEYTPSSDIISREITGISNKDGWRYELEYRNLKEHLLFSTFDAAVPMRDEKLLEEQEHAKRQFEDSYVRAKKSQLWSHGYHKAEIKRHERHIEWHRLRLDLIKEKK